MSEFFEDLKFDAKQPAAKGKVWLALIVALIALVVTLGISGIFVNARKDLKTLAREQLKNQYMLAALCNMPENQSACVAGLSDFEYDKD